MHDRLARQRRWGAAAALLVAGLAMAACSTTGGSGNSSSTATPTSASGSNSAATASGMSSDGNTSSSSPAPTAKLTIATSFGIDDLDPLKNAFWGPEFGYVDLLMRPERNGQPTPWLLEKLTTVDTLTWRLTMRPNVKFENGRAFDAAALAQLLTYTAKNNDSFATAASFASAAATGALQVDIKTKTPTPGMANILADESNVPVFDVDAYQKFLDSKADPSALIKAGIYTGPYEMTSLTSETAELQPNPTYWNGTPALQHLTIKFVPEATARVQAVQAGEADLALYMPTAVAATLASHTDAKFVTGQPSGTVFALQINEKSKPYDDPLVRRALLAAIDYRQNAQDVLNGLAQVATAVYPPSVPYAVATQSTDLDQAKSLLDQAGWTAGSGGARTKDGKSLALHLLSYPQQPDSNTLAVAMQSQLKAVGIDVKVDQVPDITASREGSDWDAAIVGDSLLSFSLSPVDGLLNDLRTGGSENYGHVSDPDLDAVIDKVKVTFDETTRNDLLKQAQQIIHDQGLWGALVLRVPAVVAGPTWQGYQPPIANLWVTDKTAPSA
jgi:peptide/nickel transport system substrate-binding protein